MDEKGEVSTCSPGLDLLPPGWKTGAGGGGGKFSLSALLEEQGGGDDLRGVETECRALFSELAGGTSSSLSLSLLSPSEMYFEFALQEIKHKDCGHRLILC